MRIMGTITMTTTITTTITVTNAMFWIRGPGFGRVFSFGMPPDSPGCMRNRL